MDETTQQYASSPLMSLMGQTPGFNPMETIKKILGEYTQDTSMADLKQNRRQAAEDYVGALKALQNPSDGLDIPLFKFGTSMMAPTKTGRFGESLANAGGLYADALAQQRKEDAARAMAYGQAKYGVASDAYKEGQQEQNQALQRAVSLAGMLGKGGVGADAKTIRDAYEKARSSFTQGPFATLFEGKNPQQAVEASDQMARNAVATMFGITPDAVAGILRQPYAGIIPPGAVASQVTATPGGLGALGQSPTPTQTQQPAPVAQGITPLPDVGRIRTLPETEAIKSNAAVGEAARKNTYEAQLKEAGDPAAAESAYNTAAQMRKEIEDKTRTGVDLPRGKAADVVSLVAPVLETVGITAPDSKFAQSASGGRTVQYFAQQLTMDMAKSRALGINPTDADRKFMQTLSDPSHTVTEADMVRFSRIIESGAADRALKSKYFSDWYSGDEKNLTQPHKFNAARDKAINVGPLSVNEVITKPATTQDPLYNNYAAAAEARAKANGTSVDKELDFLVKAGEKAGRPVPKITSNFRSTQPIYRSTFMLNYINEHRGEPNVYDDAAKAWLEFSAGRK